jgi:hypothetical protein
MCVSIITSGRWISHLTPHISLKDRNTSMYTYIYTYIYIYIRVTYRIFFEETRRNWSFRNSHIGVIFFSVQIRITWCSQTNVALSWQYHCDGISWQPLYIRTPPESCKTAESRYALNHVTQPPTSFQDTSISQLCILPTSHLLFSFKHPNAGGTLLYQTFAEHLCCELGSFYNHSLNKEGTFLLIWQWARLLPLTWHTNTQHEYSHTTCSVLQFALTLKAQWLLYVPPGLTFTNSTFCPHSVFMCFEWISEQTAIISLYSINCLAFITETACLLRGTDLVFIYNSG